jgi:Zn-dependent protease with chaperone function
LSTHFFENQEAARRNTARLVFLFALAVVAINCMLYALAVALTGVEHDPYTGQSNVVLQWWQPELLATVSLATLAIVAAGSLYKIAQLRGGGAVVAESLGGTLVAADTGDPDERKLLNVVEEMAVASGTPTPPVYLLRDEQGINAFAAGFTPGDAVVGVTRGCVRQLSRDQLQGVIAHEFSHILSGDMRLNIRLMGVIHGILIIGIIGYFLMRSSMFAGHGRRSRDNSGMALLAAGVGLMIIGFLGTFFGNLLKASVSRQREFLADASAVQFTRNPDGIAGALKKIGGYEGGSILESPNAPESSHLFFSQGLRGGLQMLFATHPEPDGSAIEQVGEPTAAHIAYASALVRDLPPAVAAAVHEPYDARAVIYALLIDRDADPRKRQLDQLQRFGEDGIDHATLRLLPEIEGLDRRARLPLIDMALPALRALSHPQYRAFEHNLQALVAADQQMDLFEWTLQRLLLTHLRPHFERVKPPRIRYASLERLALECSVVLSTLAYVGHRSEATVRAAFQAGAAQLAGAAPELLPPDRCGLRELDAAFERLVQVQLTSLQPLLAACAACIAADHTVTPDEGELMRAIADALGCPMPPLLPGQALA